MTTYRSDEEHQFAMWLEEAEQAGLVSGWEYEPEQLVLLDAKTYPEVVRLKTKTKTVERHLHRSAAYTPDFVLKLTVMGKHMLYDVFRASLLANVEDRILVDVKGAYTYHQTDGRYFELVRKLVYDRYRMWIEKLIPFKTRNRLCSGFFVDTWCPEPLRWMKARKTKTLTKIGSKCRTIKEFMETSAAE